MSDALDTGIGLAARGLHTGASLAQLVIRPARLAARTPVVGPPFQRLMRDLAADGQIARAQARGVLERVVGEMLAAPEIERVMDRALAGTFTDAAGRSLGRNRVPERIAAEILASVDLDELIGTVLDHEMTGRVVDRTLSSPEMDRIVRYVATSPYIAAAVSRQTQTLAEEMATDMRRRSRSADDISERAVRGWLHRPRHQPT